MTTLILLALLQATAAPADADPLAPARQGKLQCMAPDRARKACTALNHYVPDGERRYRNTTRALLTLKPLVTLEITVSSTIEGDAYCGTVTRADLEAATVFLGKAEAPDSLRKRVIDATLSSIRSDLGKKACSRVRPDGDLLLQKSEVDGVSRPDLMMRFIWVDPEEGYRLGGGR